ncbi:spore germination protein [Bacillus sp. FSL K6-3431]|uniref:spore germination protein n=1 Tax=Bacillus sp. FSL K6-3431 TaxID=2921500 RepID=UPI0030FA9575
MPSLFKRAKHKKESQKNHVTQLPMSIEYSLEANLDIIKQKTGNSPDVITRKLIMGNSPETKIALVYVDGIVDSQFINDFLIEAILEKHELQEKIKKQEAFEMIAEGVVAIGSINPIRNWEELFYSLMSGETIILMDEINEALSVDTKGGERRSIEEPSTQVDIMGPKIGFTESIGTNTAMVRRIIKNTNLWVETLRVGKVTNTDIVIMYVNGIANEKIIKETQERLKTIDTDSILDSGYIEAFIEDQAATLFPTMYRAERPDVVAGNLLEGKIAVFVDGSPFVLLVPAVFVQFFQTADDYYFRSDIASALRILRVIILVISLFAPALYIAATTFHHEMIPTKLLIVIAAQRETVPFPAFFEAVLMEVTFEILREAGVRLPKPVGTAVSIVGALVVGQAAVEAGIVSAAMVIIVAITAIANFATPNFGMAISLRLLRFGFMIAAATFGIYGIVLGGIVLIVHLTSLRSFGVPYMTPLAPFIPGNTGDTVVRVPWWNFNKRPELIANNENLTRQGEDQMPGPSTDRGMVNNSTDKDDRNEP